VVWVPIAAWCAAGAGALVVLGFCAYEIAWKTKRLRADLQKLESLAGELPALRRQLADAQARVAATTASGAGVAGPAAATAAR
jgi:hypothetical protein